jgi:hypothetical protein
MSHEAENTSVKPRFLHAAPDHKWTTARREQVAPYRGALDMECSIYYYWWLYQCLMEGFYGDPDHNDPNNPFSLKSAQFPLQPSMSIRWFYQPKFVAPYFWAWWQQHGIHLFCEPHERTVRKLVEGSAVPSSGSDTTVAIPVELPVTSVVPQVQAMIAEHGTSKTKGEGRVRSTAVVVSQARYRIEKTASLRALYRYAETFLLVQYLKQMAEQEFRMGLALACARERRGAAPLPETMAELAGYEAALISDLGKEASRRYSSALRLMDGVHRKRFPYYARVPKQLAAPSSGTLGFMGVAGDRYRSASSVNGFALQLRRFKPLSL